MEIQRPVVEPADPAAPRSSVGVELTTVSSSSATFHEVARGQPAAVVLDGLEPGTTHEYLGISFTTLERPIGVLRCRFATVNDVHFGESEAGKVGDSEQGPIVRADAGAPPYPEVMNRAAVAEIEAGDPVAVVVKGDLTDAGSPDEFAAFEACYRTAFGDRLHVVRGNHDSYRGATDYAGDQWIELPGVSVALIDTAREGRAGGDLDPEQLDWLDERCGASTMPVIVMGHHPQFFPGSMDQADFLLSESASRSLDALFERRSAVIAYTSGHTHRCIKRPAGGGVPSVEVASVKDFPGAWAEYEVYDGGVLQIVHRISAPDALAWSERCRVLYSDFGIDYVEFALGRLDHRCFSIPLR